MIDRDTTTIEAQLRALSPAAVSRLASRTLGGAGWDVPQWSFTRLNRSVGAATAGIYRLSGTAERASQRRPWSCILKVVSPGAVGITGAEGEDQTHPLYWKREVLAYQSGWLNHLPGGIRGPRCFGAEPQPGGSVWLWLEEVHDRYNRHWPIEQYAHAARCLGRFNGAYLAGEPWPPYAWLDRQDTQPRGVIEAYGWVEELVRDPATWEHPLLRQTFAQPLVAGLRQLWTNRHRLYAALERMPQTLCHQDAWPGNMAAAGDELIVLDWAYAGRSVLGNDLGDLAVVGYSLVETDLTLAAIDEAVFDSYLEGLQEAGFVVDRNRVRFAYASFASLKYGCLLVWLRDVPNQQRHAFWERVAGRPMESNMRRQAVVVEHLLHLHDEAVSLLEVI